MLKFPLAAKEMPEKRAARERSEDFGEIYREYATTKAREQAERCSQCGVPFCQAHCPLENNIPDWLKLTAEGRLREAWELSQATNSFPEICGRICPQDRLCEGSCVIEQSGHETVTIGAIERWLTENAWENGWIKPPLPQSPSGHSVGIIGAGPAGLAAAGELRAAGCEVVIYDQHDRPGGLLTYGIPGFKLEKDVVMRRIHHLQESGILFRTSARIGNDAGAGELAFSAIREQHDAILIATGVCKARDLAIPGAQLEGVEEALEYLITANRTGFGELPEAFTSGRHNAAGKHVVVIGGGDTAMDCVRTAIRQSAASVRCVYRRDRANMPGSAREVANACDEGVEFLWLSAPRAFLGNSRVEKLRIHHMMLGAAGRDGRSEALAIPGSDEDLKADMIIKALGFQPEDLPALFDTPDLAVTPWGTLKAPLPGFRTSLSGVYAAGDIVRGASLVVWAIRDGRDAAAQIIAGFREESRDHHQAA